MENRLSGKRVAILVAEGFEQSELDGPQQALEEAGAETLIVSPAADRLKPAATSKLIGNGDRVCRLAAAVELDDDLEDLSVRRLVKVVGIDDFDHVCYRLARLEHRTKYRLFRIKVVRRYSV